MTLLEQAKPPVSSSRDHRLKVLLVGPTGSGKTTGAATIPGKKLVIDTDNRCSSLVGLPDIDILTEPFLEPKPTVPRAWNNFCKAIDELWTLANKGSLPYSCIIFDGISSINRISMNWSLSLRASSGQPMAKAPGGGPSQPHYGPQMNAFSTQVFRAIALPCHVVFTGHYDIFEDAELGTLSYLPKVYGKIRTEIGGWFDETYETYRKETGKKTNYYWRTSGSGRMDFLKSSMNQLGKYWSDPVHVDMTLERPGFQHLLDLRFGKEND